MDTDDNGISTEDSLHRFIAEKLAAYLANDGEEPDPNTVQNLDHALRNDEVAGALQQLFNPEARKKAAAQPAVMEATTVPRPTSSLRWNTAEMLRENDTLQMLRGYFADFEARLSHLETREDQRTRDEAAARLTEANARKEAAAREEATVAALTEELQKVRAERERWFGR